MTNLTTLMFGLCLLCYSCTAQKQSPALTEALPTTLDQQTDSVGFPETWVGDWIGALSIYNAKGLAQEIPMELQIHRTDSVDRFTWKIIYGEDKVAGARNYELVVKDREKGEYVVDELNSIALECYLIDNKLFSWYVVQDNLILVTNEVNGEEMQFEVIAGSQIPVSTTGGTSVEDEEIPEVDTYPVNAFQRARLMRRR